MSKLKVIQELTNSGGRLGRYRYAKVELDGTEMFMKQAISDNERENLYRELVWSDFLATQRDHCQGVGVRAPANGQVLDDGSYVSEWISGDVLVSPTDGRAWESHLARYTQLLVALDEAALTYQIPDVMRKFTTRQVSRQLEWWLRGVVLPEPLQAARKQIEAAADKFDYRMQHGDLTPWQILVDGDEWVVIDGERSGDDLPRFNDVAYSFGRLAIRSGNEPAAWRMLAEFAASQVTTPDEKWQLQQVIALRLLGMYGDAIKESDEVEQQVTEALLEEIMKRDTLK